MPLRNTLRSTVIAAALGATTAAILAAIVLPSWAQSPASAVSIDNFTFNPQKVTVKAGTTITWTNKDDIPHAIAAVGKEFKSKVLDTDNSFSFTFTTPGNYNYFCSLHPHMTGTIVVEAATGGDAGH
jgi:plastocyanin